MSGPMSARRLGRRIALVAALAALLPAAMVSLAPAGTAADPSTAATPSDSASPTASPDPTASAEPTSGGGAGTMSYSGVSVPVSGLAAAPKTPFAEQAKDLGPMKQTHELTRDYFQPDGTPVSTSNSVTVKIDRDTNIQDNERIHISWTGAHPTGARTTNPFGAGGMDQEYPMMILECRGNTATVTPQTCWTDSAAERTQTYSTAADNAVWLDDKYDTDDDAAAANDGATISGMDDAELGALSSLNSQLSAQGSQQACTYGDGTAAHITPFVTAAGQAFLGCGDSSGLMPPEACQTCNPPPNEIAAFTDANGDGTDEFEVLTNANNESLGCSSTIQCSVVAVPIEGLSCASPSQTQCNQTGYYRPGQQNDGEDSAQLAVSAKLWWSPSNWRNRFVFPLQFAPPPSYCTLTASTAPVPFYGSELLSQAALQWTPAYCLNKSRFNWKYNDSGTTDLQNFNLMQTGVADAAVTAQRRPGDADVGYAPTAVTGWGIAFDIDTPQGIQETSLKLTPLLLAKLLTESYPGDTLGAARPGLSDNPYSITVDPEFEALNPGLVGLRASDAASTLLALNDNSDVMHDLTSYIAANKQAMAFIDGHVDHEANGVTMRVNPAYKGIRLPVSQWPLKDSWYPKDTGSACLNAVHEPYLQNIANPLGSLWLVSEAMLYAWPEMQTLCLWSTTDLQYEVSRVAQQGIGSRFMLGVVDLGDAARYGLTVADLQSRTGHFASPDDAGLKAALGTAKPTGRTTPYDLTAAGMSRSAAAYPGTSVLYTAAKTSGLDPTAAQQVAQFMRVSSTEGQVEGRGNGQLPDGYLPITDSGVTKGLYDQAQYVARLVAAQKDSSSTPTGTGPSTPTGPTGGQQPGTTTGSNAIPPVPGGGTPPTSSTSAAPTQSASPTTTTATVATTAAVTSGVGGSLMPLLLGLGIVAGLATAVGRLWLRMRGLR